MAKRSSKKHRPVPKPAPRASTPRELGISAFRQSKFDQAIQEWSPLEPTADVVAAIAEVRLRRALSPCHPPAAALAELRRAVELCPAEPRFVYHLALLQHRTGDLAEARGG